MPFPTTTETVPIPYSLDSDTVGWDRFEPLPTPDDLRKRYLHGVPFEDDFGSGLSKDVVAYHINAALSDFETIFDTTIVPREYVEPHDYKYQEYQKYGYIQLFKYPIIELLGVELRVRDDGSPLIQLPTAWFRVSPRQGQLQVVATSAAVSNFVIGNVGDLPRVFFSRDYFPQLIFVHYKAGYERDKIPTNVIHWVSLKAAVGLLHVAGDIVLGPGIASQSIGLGSLSQSISTTKTQGGAFAGRITFYETQLKEMTRTLKRYYKGIALTVA